VINHLGKIPKEGDKIAYEGLEITIKSADVRKIDKILITRKDLSPPPDGTRT
jgi:CBS domain containing-hemolysin-like protein